ncbi:MAG: MerR family DNA-binding transcriptional regulator [Caulobacteraceae bacterium]|nr:MerR family DNA-binding transcriptional regulator [Caulobacter sp.]
MSSPKPDRSWSIRQLCDEFGVTPRALRFYEDQALLAPLRRGQARVYDARDRARLQLIVRGRRVGFSLAELRDMLDLYDERDGGAVQMAASLPRFRARIEALRAQRDDIDHAIASLEDGCARLQQRLEAIRPDLLPEAETYDRVLRARLDDAHP